MPKKPSPRPKLQALPSGAQLQAARETLAALLAGDFSSAALQAALGRHEAPPPGLADALLQAYLEAVGSAPDDLAKPGQFVSFMILLVGRKALLEALGHLLQRSSGLGPNETSLLGLLELAGAELPALPPGLPELPRELTDALLRDLKDGLEGYEQIAMQLLMVPASMRGVLFDGLLRAGAGHPKLLACATFLLLTLLDRHTQATLAAWLRRQGDAGAWVLARLKHRALAGPNPVPELALDWPVVQVYATFPDGCGSQAFYVSRQRPERRAPFAIASVVISDWRGVVDGFGRPRMTRKEHDQYLDELASGGAGLAPVPIGYLRGRLDQAMHTSQLLGLPFPFDFRLSWNLFAGLPQEPPPDLAEQGARWARPKRLADTDRLADEAFFQGWFFPDTGAAATRGFFAEAGKILTPPESAGTTRDPLLALMGLVNPMPVFTPAMERALDQAIARWLPTVLDGEARQLWAGRLLQVAYLQDRLGEPDLRELAATAALALAPGSGVPLENQPLAFALLHHSAFRHAMRQDEQRMAARLQELAAVHAPRPKARARSAGPAEAYQLKIALKGAKPPIWRRVLVRSDSTLAELHRVIQAAMGWEDYHLHVFTIDGEEYGTPDRELGHRDETKVKLARVLQEGMKFTYEYDFGDGWEHQITLEKQLPLDPDRVYPACLKGKGACPPEDAGGLWGYYDKLDILAQPRHPEHKDVKRWMPPHFDPDHFDLAEANARLQALGKGRRRR